MAKSTGSGDPTGDNVLDYRHKNAKRLNIPPAGIAARGNEVLKVHKLGQALYDEGRGAS